MESPGSRVSTGQGGGTTLSSLPFTIPDGIHTTTSTTTTVYGMYSTCSIRVRHTGWKSRLIDTPVMSTVWWRDRYEQRQLNVTAGHRKWGVEDGGAGGRPCDAGSKERRILGRGEQTRKRGYTWKRSSSIISVICVSLQTFMMHWNQKDSNRVVDDLFSRLS